MDDLNAEREDALKQLMALPDPPELAGRRGHHVTRARRPWEYLRKERVKTELEHLYWQHNQVERTSSARLIPRGYGR